jgi:hypothetical protein
MEEIVLDSKPLKLFYTIYFIFIITILLDNKNYKNHNNYKNQNDNSSMFVNTVHIAT